MLPCRRLAALVLRCTVPVGVAAASLAAPAALRAQPRPRAVQVGGSLTVSSDFYGQTGRAYDVRPAALAGLQGAVSVTLPGGITLPFSAYASTEGGAGYQHPFNQIGASPTWRWGRAHGGYFSTRFSDLTLGDARLLGGGVELSPGAFRVGAVYGQAQRAVEADSLRGRLPLYRRRLAAVQLGAGREEGWHLWLNGLRAWDDAGSLDRPIAAVRPEENVVVSATVGGKIGRYVRLRGEVAGSAWTGNRLADSLASDDADVQRWVDRLRPLIAVNGSTRFDYAGTAQLDLAPVEAVALGVQARYVGPGFRSLGAVQTEADVFDLVLNPSLRLARVQASVRVGLRQNNVAGTRLDTRRRALYAATVVTRVNERLSVTLDGSNYGLRLNREADTVRVASVARAFSVSPVYTLASARGSQSVSGTYAYQDFVDENRTSGEATTTRNHTASLTHVWARARGVSFTTNGTYVVGLTRDLDTRVLSLSESVQHRLRGGKLTLSGGLTFTQSTVPGASVGGVATDEQNDRGFSARARASYRLGPRGTLEATANGRVFRYGRPRAGRDGSREGTARLAYTYSF